MPSFSSTAAAGPGNPRASLLTQRAPLTISFTSPPSTIRHILHRSSLHRLARQLAQSHSQQCILYEPVCSAIRSSTLDARQKGIAATLFSGGLWPRDRLRAAGYDAPPECELCGDSHGLADSLHHRLWVCPHSSVVAARAQANCSPAILQEALEAHSHRRIALFTAARLAVNPSEWPAPAEHFSHVFQLAAADGTLEGVHLAAWERRDSTDEACYIDGACCPPRRPRPRPPWVGCGVRKNDRNNATASTPVWHPSEQTCGAAEWTALCGIVQILQTPPSSTPTTPPSLAPGTVRLPLPPPPQPLDTAASPVSSTPTP